MLGPCLCWERIKTVKYYIEEIADFISSFDPFPYYGVKNIIRNLTAGYVPLLTKNKFTL